MTRRTLGWGFVLVLGLASACGSSADAPSEAPPPTPIVPRATVAPAPPPSAPPPSAPPPSAPPTTVAPPSGPSSVGVGSGLGPSSDAWRVCATDADCVLVRTPCGGDTAASREHAEEMQRAYDAMIPLADCASGGAPPRAVEPACVNALCVARPALGGLGASGIGVGGS